MTNEEEELNILALTYEILNAVPSDIGKQYNIPMAKTFIEMALVYRLELKSEKQMVSLLQILNSDHAGYYVKAEQLSVLSNMNDSLS